MKKFCVLNFALLPILVLAQAPPPPPPPPPPPFAMEAPRDVATVRTGTASISGVVMTDEATGRPLRHAVVTVNGSGLTPSRIAVTDEQGRFHVDRLPDGTFTVSATKPAYVRMAYGQKRPGRGSGAPVAVSAGQQVADIVIKLPRGAVISGTLTDESGQPYRSAQVAVQEWGTINGERRLLAALGLSSILPNTDDRGRYRMFGLPAGEYVVSASLSPIEGFGQNSDLRPVTPAEVQWANAQIQGSGAGAVGPNTARTPPPPPGQSVGIATSFYPGTPDASAATVIKVAAGEERDGIDFSVGLVPMARVSGVVLGPDGTPVTNASLMFANASPSGRDVFAMFGGVIRMTQDGKFTSNPLTPGHYVVMARTATPTNIPTMVNGVPAAPGPPPSPTAGMWAMTEIDLNGRDITDLVFTLQPGMKMSGRVVFEPSEMGLTADPTRARVILLPVQSGPGIGTSAPNQGKEDGSFELLGITPGQYRLSVGLANSPGTTPGAGWTVKSAVLGGRDVADAMLDIEPGDDLSNVVVTLTEKSGEISGRLLDGLGRPTTDYYAIVYSTNKAHWVVGNRRLKVPVRPATDGRFRFTSLPSGEYFIAALTEVDQRDLGDTSFLEQVSASALRITLAEGEKKTQDLRLAGGN